MSKIALVYEQHLRTNQFFCKNMQFTYIPYQNLLMPVTYELKDVSYRAVVYSFLDHVSEKNIFSKSFHNQAISLSIPFST